MKKVYEGKTKDVFQLDNGNGKSYRQYGNQA